MFWKKILEHKFLQLENAINMLHKIQSKRSSRAIMISEEGSEVNFL